MTHEWIDAHHHLWRYRHQDYPWMSDGMEALRRDYLVAGPYNKLTKYRPQDWNEIEITVQGGTARCTCNGELLEEAFPVPATGPIGLEGDRGQMEYRRIRIKELR